MLRVVTEKTKKNTQEELKKAVCMAGVHNLINGNSLKLCVKLTWIAVQ